MKVKVNFKSPGASCTKTNLMFILDPGVCLKTRKINETERFQMFERLQMQKYLDDSYHLEIDRRRVLHLRMAP